MINKRLEDIEKADIDALVAGGVGESRTLDYKETLPGGGDEDKKEFLYDASSFANAAGGLIVYGVKEVRDTNNKPTGLPASADGLAATSADAEILRLENILRTGIDPRIPVARFKAIPGFKDGPVLVLRVDQSWAAPHMVIFKNASRFYSRNSAGKYPLDVREIRAAFALSESIPERIRRFRDDRLARIVAGETPVDIPSRGKFVLHMVPVTAVEPSALVELNLDKLGWLAAPHLDFVGLARDQQRRYNLDGALVYDRVILMPNEKPICRSYAQLFRSGAIEAVAVLDNPTGLDGYLSEKFESLLIQDFRQYLEQVNLLGIQPPLFVMTTLLGAKGFSLWVPTHRYPESVRGAGANVPFDRNVMLLPDLNIEDLSALAEDILRPALDALWQAGGWERCHRYNKDGRFIWR
jgi:hypothetical protein